jgi:hypothetical protein
MSSTCPRLWASGASSSIVAPRPPVAAAGFVKGIDVKPNNLKVAGAGVVLCLAATASAQVFSDNFDATAAGLNISPSGWTTTDGTVDTIGPGLFDLLPGNGNYIDLDGSTANAGVLSRSFSALSGNTYEATFVLAGSRRGDTNSVDVSFGSATDSFVLASGAGPTTYTLSFTPGSDGTFSLSFGNQGGDNLGALLLSVSVNADVVGAIPEPQTYALMLAGLAAVGAVARRRRAGGVRN